jgi:hypothetical protein
LIAGSVEPGMGNNLVDCETLAGVLSEHTGDQILCLVTEAVQELIRLEDERLANNASLALSTVVMPEGESGGQ